MVKQIGTSGGKPVYLDKNGQRLPDDAPGELVAESVYEVPIKKGIMYQPHPAFAKDEQGQYRYHRMKPGEVGERRSPMDHWRSNTAASGLELPRTRRRRWAAAAA